MIPTLWLGVCVGGLEEVPWNPEMGNHGGLGSGEYGWGLSWAETGTYGGKWRTRSGSPILSQVQDMKIKSLEV